MNDTELLSERYIEMQSMGMRPNIDKINQQNKLPHPDPEKIKQYNTEKIFKKQLDKVGARWVVVNGDFHCPYDQLIAALQIKLE